MVRQFKRESEPTKSMGGFRHVLIPLWLAVIVLLTATCVDSKTVTPHDESSHPPTTSSASAVRSSSVPHPAGEPPDQYLKFGRLTTENGLSSDTIWGIAQDRQGFMWFGTDDGLNRYDGIDFKLYRHDADDPNSLSGTAIRGLIEDHTGTLWVGTWSNGLNQFDHSTERFIRYQHDPDDPQSLSNDAIRDVYEDRAGTLWIGTMGGLNKYNRDTKNFTRFQHNPDDPNSLSENSVWEIYEDRAGVLWVGTSGGLNRFDPETEQFIHYQHDPADPDSLSNYRVSSFYEDRSGTLWLGTFDGLNRFDRDTESFTRYQHDPADPHSLNNNIIMRLYEDHAGELWIGFWGGGLDRFNPETETFTHYQHNPADPHSLINNNIYMMYRDRAGMVWIATEGGISILDRGGKPFRHYRFIPGDPNSLSDNSVRAIYEDRAGVLWVGTNSGGLNEFDRETGQFAHYLHDPDDPNSLSHNTVKAIYEDRTGNLWIGTWGGGLNKFDRETGIFTHYQHDSADPHSLSHNVVLPIYEDRRGNLWIGTWGGGLNKFDRETEQFTRYKHDPVDPDTLSNNQVVGIYEDRSDDLWIGTIGGLNRFNREAETFTRYHNIPTDPNSLSNDSVYSFYEDGRGEFWIGTWGGGLNKFDRENEQFTHYTVKNGLSSNTIWGILEEDASSDGAGNLWLSTTAGLSRFDPQTETFRNYDVNDGLQSNTFHSVNDYYKGNSGELFFGGVNGLTTFYPEQIVDNQTPPPVVITNFQLANKPVPIGGDSVLQKSILNTDHLLLSYLDRVFSFEFAALNYRATEKNQYKYRMEGFEKEWNEVDSTRRFATYTNLDPGDYVFKVIGSNNDGVWNEEGASIRITITPPWWEAARFRIGMMVLAMSLLVGGYRLRVGTLEARSRELEDQVQERTQDLEIANKAAREARDVAETANRAKSTFLSNMSHELRTPLHAILGFNRLLTRDSGLNIEQQERLDIINRSGEHLLGMVDDILSLSKIEAGRIELKLSTFDVTQMLQDVGQMMKSRAEGKSLRITLDLDPELPPYVHGDAEKLRQVLINLLGNAVKFTETGDVWLRARSQPVADNPDMMMLRLEVQDSGPGIPQDRLDEVFDTFVQLHHTPNTEEGTGLGLAISKTLVDMMDGEIAVESKPGEGALFTVGIPLQLAEAGATMAGDLPTTTEVVGLISNQPDWRILVVDDNRENRLLLRSLLSRVGFDIQEAGDGAEAIIKYKQWHPHFIWMDMRMPVLDGYAATIKIRELPGGDEVKIVAVTASVLMEQREAILASGCEDVVHKPFRDQEIFDAMARYLDVQYLYGEREGKTDRNQGIKLTSEMLAELPRALLDDLRQLTLVLDREATLQAIERIEPQAPDTAEGLRILVLDFQMGRLGELLGEIRE